MMLLRNGKSAVRVRAKGWPNGPKPVGKPLFTAYKMDQIPDDCDVMVKLQAKFVQYDEEDQQTGYVRSFLHHPGQEDVGTLQAHAATMKPFYTLIGSRGYWRQGAGVPAGWREGSQKRSATF